MLKNNLVTYSIIALIMISLFGFNFMINIIGNLILLLFLISLLLITLVFLGFNSFKSKLKTCESCGSAMISEGETCLYCGSNLENNEQIAQDHGDASSKVVEIEAEEIK